MCCDLCEDNHMITGRDVRSFFSGILLLMGIVASSRTAAAQPADQPPQIDSGMVTSPPDTSFGSVPAPLPPDDFAWYSMITNIPGDWLASGRTIFREESIPAILGIATLSGVLLLGDQATYDASESLYRGSPPVHTISDVCRSAGDGRATLGVAGAFAVYGFIGRDRRALRTASQTVEALLASGFVVQLLKRVAGRESPQAASTPRGKWRPFPSWSAYNRQQARYYSFPSGHVTTIMATVTVLAENYPDERWIRPIGYALVGATGFGLVNAGWHWYSDFPLAVALGYMFGTIAADRSERGSAAGEQGREGGLHIMPGVARQGPQLVLAYSF